MDPRLNTFNDFLDIATYANEMDVVFVFVNVIPEHLLTLFIDEIDIIDDEHFFLSENRTLGLTERFHFVSVIIDSLLFEIVDKENIGFGENIRIGISVIIADHCVQ
jgi:hypothetical protein